MQANPTNVANLVQALATHMFMLLSNPSFPCATVIPPDTVSTNLQVLNCLRVLGRILVIVFEAEGESSLGGQTWADKYLWNQERVKREPPEDLPSEQAQFTIADDDDDDEEDKIKDNDEKPEATETADGEIRDPLSNPGPSAPKNEDDGYELRPSLADRLFSCTIDLLFCAGFTVPESVRGDDLSGEKINYVIWEKGVGSTIAIGSNAELDRNKVEVLRFLLVLVSKTVYTSPTSLQIAANPPLEHLTHDLERRLVLSLLCSLLNTSVAGTKPSATSAVPYNHLMFKAADERRTLIRMCLMNLLVALDYRSFDIVSNNPAIPEKKDENAFRYFLAKLHRKDDLAFVLNGILAILEEHTATMNNYLPGSKKPIPYLLEAYMLLWRLVDLNKRFRSYVFESGKAIDVIGHILLCCLEYKNDPSQHGLLRLLSYLLQTLSADQGFAEALNQPLRQTVPAKWAVQGSAADFMIVSVYSIATTPGLNPLFPALTISIANVAPYLRHLGVQASTRLLQLFKAFSAPNFLLADEGHPRLVYYLLETFNAVLYHQLNENPNLVYAILRSHQDFQTLATFTLVGGLREIQRKKAQRAQALEAEKEKEAAKGSTLKRTDSELAMLAEKAALLGREIEEGDLGESHERVRDVDASHGPDDEFTVVVPKSPKSSPGSVHTPKSPDAHGPSAANGTPGSPGTPAMSEKARGKMRATESVTSLHDEEDEELLKLAAGGVGPNGYVPTQEWVSSWQKGLPLDPVLVAISELLPKFQDSQPATRGGPSSKVFNLLKGASLTDVLPPAPPVVPRRFLWSPQSCIWLSSLLWGDIYVAGLTNPTGVWRDTTVRLFGVKQAPSKRGVQVDRVLKMIGVV